MTAHVRARLKTKNDGSYQMAKMFASDMPVERRREKNSGSSGVLTMLSTNDRELHMQQVKALHVL